jgi:hypothetical protein
MDEKESLLVKFGEVIGSVKGMSKDVQSLTAQQNLTRIAFEKQGLFLASLYGDVQDNKKTISKVCKRLDIEEGNTNRIVIEKQVKQDQRKTWKWALGAAIALAGTAGTIIAALAAAGG